MRTRSSDPVATAQSFLAVAYPHAQAAFLGGSASAGRWGPTSDLDILVLIEPAPGHDQVAYVETTTHLGWLIESFVYDEAGRSLWFGRDRHVRQPVLDSLVVDGLSLIPGAAADKVLADSRAAIAGGPAPPEQSEIDQLRYTISALIDDLADAATSGSPAEAVIIRAEAFRAACELALLIGGGWLGTGKWLVRRLRDVPDHGLVDWARNGGTDDAALTQSCQHVLAAAGGWLQEGYTRGTKPT